MTEARTFLVKCCLRLFIAAVFGAISHPALAADLYDCALIFDPDQPRNSDANFKAFCQFYGLRCREIDLRETELADSLLRDATGEHLAGIGINMQTLVPADPPLLDSMEVAFLQEIVDEGAHLLISGLITAGAQELEMLSQLTDGRQAPGRYVLTWDGRNQAGLPVASGVYFCALQTPQAKATRKMVLLR